MAGEFVDLEGGGEAAVIVDSAFFQVDGELVVGLPGGALDNFFDFFFCQNYREDAVLYAVVGEDICERWGDDCSETEIFQGPDGVFT